MAYAMWIGKMLMPVTPSKIETTIRNKNKTITLINEGEVNLLKTPGLTSIKTTVMLPHTKYPFATAFQPMSNYLDYFEALKQSKMPFQFIVSRSTPGGKILFDSNISVTLEDYQIIDDAKNGFDVDVSINLKQWRSYGTKTITINRPSDTAPVVMEEERPTVTNPEPSKESSSNTNAKKSAVIEIGAKAMVTGAVLAVPALMDKITSTTGKNLTQVTKPSKGAGGSANRIMIITKN